MIFQDARDYQILFLGSFLLLGISTRDWTLRPDLILVLILSCLLTQILLSGAGFDFKMVTLMPRLSLNPPLHWRYEVALSWRSALITALGLCLLLRANEYSTLALAGVGAIASKFFFRFRGKHFFNPANFGIIAALLFTNDAWVSPGQWGTDWWYLLLFLGTGGMILKRVGRWDTSAAFLLAYTILEAMRNFYLGWSWDVLHHQLMSGSLLLFALFMLTDPRSIPNSYFSRLIWAIALAVLTFILQHQFYLETAMFWALFILSPCTIFLDKVWSAPRFSWQFIPRRAYGAGLETIS
ncbi:MAG: RnfABCDGE type electron transport complex subunit D [Gomphosphaeria aponina SAG 52.96 = DSM 107014]|uniref:RnfABCDGE type electron transport complex subunit D n=1 Tax=Gomphosphaeria aponina SAG 52.96 = DSM 107014 TaxID=1521640 RepID=A0A941JNV7_9CHRO|nr:RnfABCDGE type electron transport complex subunit D [Gomphosphaeria aponina SAG 52.96 = DSM 107014]